MNAGKVVAGVSDNHHHREIRGITLAIHGFSLCTYAYFIYIYPYFLHYPLS